MVETQKAKEFQMKKFLSEGAIEMVEKSENKANPETYIVQKNVKREQVRWSASSRWSSSLCCHMRISGQMTR